MFSITRKLLQADLMAALEAGSDLNSMNFADLNLIGIDFSGKRLTGCSFAHTCFTNCSFTGVRIRISFFDFARFDSVVYHRFCDAVFYASGGIEAFELCEYACMQCKALFRIFDFDERCVSDAVGYFCRNFFSHDSCLRIF